MNDVIQQKEKYSPGLGSELKGEYFLESLWDLWTHLYVSFHSGKCLLFCMQQLTGTDDLVIVAVIDRG